MFPDWLYLEGLLVIVGLDVWQAPGQPLQEEAGVELLPCVGEQFPSTVEIHSVLRAV